MLCLSQLLQIVKIWKLTFLFNFCMAPLLELIIWNQKPFSRRQNTKYFSPFIVQVVNSAKVTKIGRFSTILNFPKLTIFGCLPLTANFQKPLLQCKWLIRPSKVFIYQRKMMKNFIFSRHGRKNCLESCFCSMQRKKKLKKNFMAPFYAWGSTAPRLEPLRRGSLLFTTKFPEIPGTHFIKLGRMKC